MLDSRSISTRFGRSGASGSVIGLNTRLSAVEPVGVHAATSVPLLKKMRRYFALPGEAALAGRSLTSDRKGENSAARPTRLVNSRRLSFDIGVSACNAWLPPYAARRRCPPGVYAPFGVASPHVTLCTFRRCAPQ